MSLGTPANAGELDWRFCWSLRHPEIIKAWRSGLPERSV